MNWVHFESYSFLDVCKAKQDTFSSKPKSSVKIFFENLFYETKIDLKNVVLGKMLGNSKEIK